MRAAILLLLTLHGTAIAQSANGPALAIPLPDCPNTPLTTLTELQQAIEKQGFQPIANLDQVWAFATGGKDGNDLPEKTTSGRGGLTLGRDNAEGWIRRNGFIRNFDPSARATTRSCRMFNDMLAARDEDFKNLQSKERTSYVCFEDGGFFVLQYTNPLEDRWKKTKEDERVEEQTGMMIFKSFSDTGISDDKGIAFPRWRRFSGIVTASQPNRPPIKKERDAFLAEAERGIAKEGSVSTTEIEFDRGCDTGFECDNGRKASRMVTIRRSTALFEDHIQIQKDGKPLDSYSKGLCSVYPK
jgi:hypothetical protein